mgnify:CR=1 FL=1
MPRYNIFIIRYMAQEKDNQNQKEGIVTEALPNTTFRVQLNDGEEILTHLAGRMRVHFIRILTGDRVLVEVSPDGSRGRIIYRYK